MTFLRSAILASILLIFAVISGFAQGGMQPGPGTVYAVAGGGGITVVQDDYTTSALSSASPLAQAFGSNVTSGNRIIVSVLHSYLGCPVSISDTLGNTYTSRGSQPDLIAGQQLFWYVFDSVSGSSGANTVTASASCGNFFGMAILEVSGTSAYDTTAGQNNAEASGTTITTGAITPSANGALVLGHFSTQANRTFSQLSFPIANAWERRAFIHYIQPTAASITLNITIDSSNPNGGGIVAYIP